MKLRTQILAIGLSGAAMAAVVGGIGLVALSRMGGAVESSIQAGQMLQSSQEADMMHDAIRGDGQLALFGALKNDAARIEEAQKGLVDHVATFKQDLARLQAANLDAASRAALTVVEPVAARYFDAAAQTVQAAHTGQQPAEQSIPALQTAFSDLEGKMAALSDAIEKNGNGLDDQAKASIGQARIAVGVALLLATVAMIVGALWLARRMTGPMAVAVDAADRLAEGDLTARIEPHGNDETQHLMEAMARMQASFVGIVREVKENAELVATASVQIASANQDLSTRTETQASALQQTAATMDQLGTTVRNNADSARQASQLALGASGVAVQGGDVVGEVVQTMKGIDDSSRRIANIIGVIDGIAFQTNILALNAAVEAARAGEQGRGFAVVAGEVRSLAQRSADAAREIKSLIGASVERVGQGTALVDRAGQTMQEIVASIRRVNDVVAEISAASTEQSAGVAQVGQAVASMDQATQQNAAIVEQTAAAAQGLRDRAQALVQAVAVFKV